jgi:CDP-diacylglycerol pyrophosphatase
MAVRERIIGACVTAILLLQPAIARADPNALWTIVHDRCVPDQRDHQNPDPCAEVNLAGGYALLKDMRGATQYLVIPTDRVSGIESPDILGAQAPNYWQAAWAARSLIEQRAGKPIPREDIGLAINSASGRSQNQLHIHIDCVNRDVRDELRAADSKIGDSWADFGPPLAGHHYRAMRLRGDDLSAHNPFKLLASGDPAAAADMGHETLAVIGASFADGSPGFYLLSDRADAAKMDMGSSETLLDHDCAVLKTPAP